MELIPMTDYVLSQNKDDDALYRLLDYANFLKRKLELGMFIPCDLEGNVLEEPKTDDLYLPSLTPKVKQYQEAKERVLFEGDLRAVNRRANTKGAEYFEVYYDNKMVWVSWNKSKIVEDLLKNHYKLTLTKSAINQIT